MKYNYEVWYEVEINGTVTGENLRCVVSSDRKAMAELRDEFETKRLRYDGTKKEDGKLVPYFKANGRRGCIRKILAD